jgi:DNA-3-methyladenine glycosylase I
MEERKAPWECFFGKEDKNKCSAGTIPESDKDCFEILSLCIFQTGLSWGSVRKMWPKLKKSFYNFNIYTLSNKKPRDILKNPNVIKNPKKVKAIIENAKKV